MDFNVSPVLFGLVESVKSLMFSQASATPSTSRQKIRTYMDAPAISTFFLFVYMFLRQLKRRWYSEKNGSMTYIRHLALCRALMIS